MKAWLIVMAVLALYGLSPSAHAAEPQKKPSAQAASADAPKETGDQRAAAASKSLIGAHAPMVGLSTIDGKTIDLPKLYGGKPVYLKFWATWCVPCLEQMPHFEHAYETLGKDITIVAVNTNFNETLQGVKTYRDKHGLKMPIVIDDGRLASALNLRVTPTHVLIDRSGKIVFVGHSADQKLDDALQKLKTSPASIGTEAAERVANPAPLKLPGSAITSSGQRFPFADADGRKLTALVFFVPWCEDYLKTSQPEASSQCRSARQQVDHLAATGTVRIIGVASGLWTNAADLTEYKMSNQVAIPLTLDGAGDMFRAFRVTRSPTIVVLAPDGHEIRRYTGPDVADFAQSFQSPHVSRP